MRPIWRLQEPTGKLLAQSIVSKIKMFIADFNLITGTNNANIVDEEIIFTDTENLLCILLG